MTLIIRALVLLVLVLAGCSGAPQATQEGTEISSVPASATGGATPSADPPVQTPGCTAGDGTVQRSTQWAYLYFAGGGQYKCQLFNYGAPEDHCAYKNSQYQASTDNICAGIANANVCTYTVPTLDSKGNVISSYVETDYLNRDLWDPADLAIEQSSCGLIGGAWR